MSQQGSESLKALAEMAAQYLAVGDTLDTMCMSAGQQAMEVLAAAGLVTYDGVRRGEWTEAGRRLLDRR